MAFCKTCGSQLEDGVAFCSKCGTAADAAPAPVQAQPNVHPQMNNAKRLHCPNCKSHEISPINETSVNGAVTTNHGSFSTSHVSNTHRNYWMCSYCGTKFRSIDNLEQEIKKSRSTPIVLALFDVVCLFLFFYFLGSAMDSTFGFLFYSIVGGSGIAALIFTIYIFVIIRNNKKMKEELEYLKANCFD